MEAIYATREEFDTAGTSPGISRDHSGTTPVGDESLLRGRQVRHDAADYCAILTMLG